MDIFLTNNLTNKKEQFVPKDKKHVGMYVCGPTVYDDPHIGNARPLVIFDILFKLLKNTFSKVTYVRNITDIDDKIIKSSQEQKIVIQKIEVLSNKTKKLEAIYTQKIADLEEMKKSVLQKAFSGQLSTIN